MRAIDELAKSAPSWLLAAALAATPCPGRAAARELAQESAQELAGEGASAGSAAKRRVSLVDVAAAFDAFDAAYHARSSEPGALDDEARARFNQRFDAVTRHVFTLDLGAAEEELCALLATLGAAAPPVPRRPFQPAPLVDDDERAWLDEQCVPAPLDAERESLWRAARALRSRIAWLEGAAHELDRFVLAGPRPPASPAAVRAEFERLREGEDPYRGLAGEVDHWRTVAHGRRDLRLRVFCPPSLDLARPVPLVVALHGAGGNEHFLFEAAGDGHLRRLARERGFIAVTPLTIEYAFDALAFEALLEGIAASYPIDREQVFVFGHSMGAATAVKLLLREPERIAAAVCAAGFGDTADTGVAGVGWPRTLVVAGALDAIVPLEGLERSVARARERGLPVAIEVFPHEGHTLLLQRALDRAVAFWLDD